ncbi:MAG: FAD-dependent oxidoreductase [Stackebrandtia sp.]
MSSLPVGNTTHYDVAVIGSGFGGSVAALRLTEKGYKVGVLEAGRRFDDPSEPDPRKRHAQLPKTSWRMRRYLWAPRLGMLGIQRIHLLRGKPGSRVLVLAGAGVGGGSLVYANTLYRPPRPFFDDPQWRDITDWESELAPFYDRAEQMLGVVDNPAATPADAAVRRVAEQLGVEKTFRLTPVGVFFGAEGETVDDPYFGGAGPKRRACVLCGSCMTGCRQGAKNMLTENYLYLAERAGATIHPRTTVTRLSPLDGGGYRVETRRTGGLRRGRHVFTADQVVLAAGAYGTQSLLHRMLAEGDLPRLSTRLGKLTRTNSEALLGVERFRTAGDDHSKGLAITSSFHPDAQTHVEPVRYGPGSNSMALLRTLLVDGPAEGSRGTPRWLKLLGWIALRPWQLARILKIRNWSRRAIIALVMQHRDNSVTVGMRRGRLRASVGHGEPNPTWLPIGHEVARRLAAETGGMAGGTWLDLVNIPTTAHFIGGCVIGATPDEGVVDPYHRVFGHPGLHIVDGSSISANLGVNPSLTIAAQAERAMSLWPDQGDLDPRPPLGAEYRRLWTDKSPM